MTRGEGLERALRWYPAAWRERYGAELAALIEDTYPDGAVSWRCRLSLLRSGTVERLRAAGLLGSAAPPSDGVRAGLVLVLWAWAVFVVAGAGFANRADSWRSAVGARGARLPVAGYDVVYGAGLVGGVIVLLAAGICAPSVVRLVRAGGWPGIRRPVILAAALTIVTIVVIVVLAVWARQLGPRERNGGLWTYSATFVAAVLLFSATVMSCSAAAAAAARRMELRPGVLRRCCALAVTLTLVMAALAAGTVAWWAAMAARAPWFLAGTAPGSAGSVAPPALVAVGTLMILGITLGVLGARRATTSLRRIT